MEKVRSSGFWQTDSFLCAGKQLVSPHCVFRSSEAWLGCLTSVPEAVSVFPFNRLLPTSMLFNCFSFPDDNRVKQIRLFCESGAKQQMSEKQGPGSGRAIATTLESLFFRDVGPARALYNLEVTQWRLLYCPDWFGRALLPRTCHHRPPLLSLPSLHHCSPPPRWSFLLSAPARFS